MKILFPNCKVHFCFLIPKRLDCYRIYDSLLVPEPDYSEYLKNGRLIFTEGIKKCITLSDFVQKTNNNSLISEIIFASEEYFRTKKKTIYSYYKDVITKLYDIENINEEEFNYYDILEKKIKCIKYADKNYYQEGILLNNVDSEIIREIKYVLGLQKSKQDDPFSE